MNKGFSYYFRNGFNFSCAALKGVSFKERLKLMFYYIVSSFAKLFLVTRPIFLISDLNVASMVAEAKDFSVEKAFQNSCDIKTYLNLLGYCAIKELVILLGGLFIMLPVILIWTMPYLYQSSGKGNLIIAIIFTVLFSIISALFILYVEITYLPVNYLAARNPNLDLGDYLYNSNKCMKGSKLVSIWISLCYGLIIALILALDLLVIILCFTLGRETGYVFGVIFVLLSLFVFLFALLPFILSMHAALYALLKDVVTLDHVVLVKNSSNQDEFENVLPEKEVKEAEEE